MRWRGWWSVGLAAALLAPSLTVQPVAAGPFDYIKKADEEKNRAQERQREQGRQQERQREAADRARQEQERTRQAEQQRQATERARQEAAQREAAERARQVEQQRQAAERARQAEQQRQAELQRQAAERARQVEQQRQIEQQRLLEQQRQVERQRQTEHQERVRQQGEQERARQEQQAREEQAERAHEAQRAQELQVQQERARRLQAEEAQRHQSDRAREVEQARRAHAEPFRQHQLRQEQLQQERFRQEQLRRHQLERVSREQTVSSRQRVAAGPFDYIRKADEARGRTVSPSQPQAPRRSEPVRREQPRSVTPERGGAGRSNPFGYIPQREQPSPYRNAPTYSPRGTTVRESPFGSIRRNTPSGGASVPTHTETPRAPGTFTPPGGSTTPPSTSPGSSPFGGVRTREPATTVTPQPRSGRGSLDSYFGRDARPHRERDRRPSYPGSYYPGPYYGGGYPGYYDRDRYYPPDPYYDPCPYDIYPPIVVYPQPNPPVVIVPAPEVVVVPEREPERSDARDDAETALLADAIEAAAEAWESGQLSLLMRYVLPEGKIDVYRDGEWAYALTRAEFEEKTRKAFRDYDTVSMEFGKPEFLNEDEARARAEHVYRTRSGQQQRVYVTYTFRRYGKSWRITALDYQRPVRARTAAPSHAPGVPAIKLETAPAATPTPSSRWDRFGIGMPGKLSLVAAPAVRLRDLLSAPRPRRLATLKWLQAGQRTLYTLEAMRGVAPGTVAWALYRQGSKSPVESGITDVGALSSAGWVAVRPVSRPLMTLAATGARGAASRHPMGKAPALATRTFADTNLALVSVRAPGKTGRAAAAVRTGRAAKGKTRRR